MDKVIAAGYIRVSTEEQSRDGLSLATQEAEIRAYCASKGYYLYRIYTDAGMTARKRLDRRESFMRMMGDVKRGAINHIVVLRLDRFFRNVYDYHKMMNEYLIPAGCGWSAVKEDYDTTTTNGRLMINLRLAIAEQECDQDSDRLKDIFMRRRMDGFSTGGIRSFGYDVVDGRYVINDKEAEIIRHACDLCIGTCSLRKTHKILASEGIDIPYYRLYSILHNEIYMGKRRENSHFCEPIIPPERFKTLQECLVPCIGRHETNTDHLFTGLMRCPECGHKLCPTFGGKKKQYYVYYRCNYAMIEKICTYKHLVSEIKTEKICLDALRDITKDLSLVVSTLKSRKRTKSNRQTIEDKINRLTDLYINGLITIDVYKQKKTALEEQIIDDRDDSDNQDDTRHINELKKIIDGGILDIYADLSMPERRALWRQILKRIDVDETGKKIVPVFK